MHCYILRVHGSVVLYPAVCCWLPTHFHNAPSMLMPPRPGYSLYCNLGENMMTRLVKLVLSSSASFGLFLRLFCCFTDLQSTSLNYSLIVCTGDKLRGLLFTVHLIYLLPVNMYFVCVCTFPVSVSNVRKLDQYGPLFQFPST